MNTLIIYDNIGYVISQMAGSVREPQGGVQFLWAEIHTGKQLKITDGIGVDVSVTPHQAILEDIPKTEIEIVKEQLQSVQSDNANLVTMLVEGGII